MAYMRDIDRRCESAGCGSRASQEVRDRHNSTIGFYCRKHARIRVADLNDFERAQRQAEGRPMRKERHIE